MRSSILRLHRFQHHLQPNQRPRGAHERGPREAGKLPDIVMYERATARCQCNFDLHSDCELCENAASASSENVQNAAHPKTIPSLNVCSRENDRRILAPQFESHRRQVPSCSGGNLGEGLCISRQIILVQVQTWRPTSSDPMKIMCLILDDMVKASA